MNNKVLYDGVGRERGQKTVLKDHDSGLSESDLNLDQKDWIIRSVGWFEQRIEEDVNDERLLPDSSAVLCTAIRIGLCRIEGSKLDAMDMVHLTWLETGKEEKLKEELLNSLSENVNGYSIEENLKELGAEDLVEIHRKLRGSWYGDG